MDRCALFIDAGYLLSDGAMAVHGTRHREQVSWDFDGLLKLLGELAREHAGMPLLRCYWYESTVEGRRGPEHEALADLPGLKLRLGRSRPGRRDGADTELHRDLMTLSRNQAIADAIVISGDEDLVSVLSDAQDLGVRVTVVHVAVDGNWTISRLLRQECDDLIELGSGQLRPYVNLLSAGVDRPLDTGPSPLANGHADTNGSTPPAVLQMLQSSAHSSTGLTPTHSPSPPTPAPAPASVPQLTSQVGGPSVLNGLTFGSTAPDPPVQPSYLSSAFGSLPTTTSTGPTPIPSPLSPPTSTSPSVPMSTPSVPMSTPSYPGLPPTPQTPSAVQPSYIQPQYGSTYTGPQSLVPQQPVSSGPSLADAVQAAHTEGQDFGESVARDAPALWLEAVLARKPRMPSDLEARLLQGSALPIDFLLHDEVRHALRRGFWDALERARR